MPTPKDLLQSVVTCLVDDEVMPARLLALGDAAAIMMMADESLAAVFTPAFGPPEALQERLHEIVQKNPGVHIKLVIIGGGLDERGLMPRAGGLLSRRAVQLFHLAQGDDGWSLWTGGGARPDSPVGRVLDRAARGELPPPDPAGLAQRVDPPAPLSPHERSRLEAGQAFVESLQVRPRTTWGLLGVLVAIFVCEMLWGGSESIPTLVRMGGNTYGAVAAGEPWRLLSSALLHAGVIHIAVNGYVLVMLGGFMEKVLGPGRYGVLLGGAALGGGLASGILSNVVVSVGASGAIWGVLGAAAALAWRPAGAIPEVIVKPLRRVAMINLGLGLAISFVPQVDLWAHLGGGLVGALLVFSGVLTRGLLHPAARDEDDSGDVSRQGRGWTIAAGVVAGVMASCLAVAWATERPWELAGEPSWAHHELTEGLVIDVPRPLGEPQSVQAEGDKTAWAFGDPFSDPLTVELILVDLDPEERAGVLETFGEEGVPPPEGTVVSLSWRSRSAEAGPCYEAEHVFPNGMVGGYWVLVRDDALLTIRSLRWSATTDHWGRTALERVYASLEDVTPAR